MKKRLYQAAFWTALAAIMFLAVTPQGARLARGTSDKVNHAIAFFILAFLGDHAFEKPFIVMALSLVGFGMMIELVQFTLPYRSFSLYDMLANIFGIVLFAVIKYVTGRRHQRLSR